MKRIIISFTLMLFNPLFSQDIEELEDNYLYEVEMNLYHEERIKNSFPSYNLSKIRNRISKLEKMTVSKSNEGGEERNSFVALPDKEFEKLADKEKFTYVMIYPEYLSKIYSDIIPIIEEDKKIFGYLPLVLDEASWSKRQIKFLKSNKKLVMNLIKEYSEKDFYIGLNYKKAIVEVKAIEMIPYLMDFYRVNKDKDILTLLMILVKDARYYPFSRSNIYIELYNEKNSHYDSYIEFNEIHEEYILKTADNYYKQSYKGK